MRTYSIGDFPDGTKVKVLSDWFRRFICKGDIGTIVGRSSMYIYVTHPNIPTDSKWEGWVPFLPSEIEIITMISENFDLE